MLNFRPTQDPYLALSCPFTPLGFLYLPVLLLIIFSAHEVSAFDDGYYYKGYPEIDYSAELSFPITLPSSEKWGLIYAGIRIGQFVIIGEIYKWAHISPQVWKQDKFG